MAGKYEEIVRCSFCNKPQSQVRKMIAGPNGVFICDQCVDVCTEIIEDELGYEEENAYDDINLLKPEEIKAFLDDYVIGQDDELTPVDAAGLPPAQTDALRRGHTQRKGQNGDKIVGKPR